MSTELSVKSQVENKNSKMVLLGIIFSCIFIPAMDMDSCQTGFYLYTITAVCHKKITVGEHRKAFGIGENPK